MVEHYGIDDLCDKVIFFPLHAAKIAVLTCCRNLQESIDQKRTRIQATIVSGRDRAILTDVWKSFETSYAEDLSVRLLQ